MASGMSSRRMRSAGRLSRPATPTRGAKPNGPSQASSGVSAAAATHTHPHHAPMRT
jgi:hypothetical protein